MNILVTGSTGFIGSRFINMAKQNLKTEDKLILLTSREIEGYTCILHNNYTFCADDFINAGINHIDRVIHIGHFLSENHKNSLPAKGNLSAIKNTEYLIEHLPNIPQVFVYCSTMDVYGIHRHEQVDENSTLQADNPYTASKIMIEMLLQEWADKQGVLLHILRLAHIYGPCDLRNYTIPIWLQAAAQMQPIKLYANPNMLRNCLYRDDCCSFMYRALYLDEDIRIINLISRHTSTMLEIAQVCKEISGNLNEILLNMDKCDVKNEVGLGFKNNDLCRQYLGEEQYDLCRGLEREYQYLMSQ